MNQIIEDNKQQIIDLCKQYHVKELYVFGSATREDFNAESDVDLLVEFKSYPSLTNNNELYAYFENMDNLSDRFSSLFKREVDLLTEKNIRNKYLKKIINDEKKLIYAEA
ncbi:nucleotidyltransferase family protein [Parafilimonas sp.]|jgi:predicted nucleotidyltransferase|uniref:nucleotidyltransferase family protein n=1 Tax=Parafilimonas sp. TaxID=1969739 RepID=UPI003F802176